MSLFGASTTMQNKPTLFGSLGTTTSQLQQQQSGGSLFRFGSLQHQSGNIANSNSQQASTPSLFGSSAPAQQQSTSLFGGALPQSQPQQNSLFASTAQQPSNPLFSNSTQQPNTSLFGNSLQQPQQLQQQQQIGGSSLAAPVSSQSAFGAPSVFRLSQQQTQQLQLGQSLGQTLRPTLWQTGTGSYPREKTIPEQMQTLFEKWSPESASCAFQHYFYNNVPPEAVPYYVPGPGEDEQKWEDALAKKPSDGSIPVLCRGFEALGNRLRIQVQSANALQARLHEINNSLTVMLQEHDLNISVRAADSRRRHLALSQRCLQLATKVQILRNRGYAMDSAEEELKRKLTELERMSFDPQLSGRQEEIWARLVGVRERARFLQEETERAGNTAQDGQSDTLDDEVTRKTRKILGDYDLQISHLQKEVEAIRNVFNEWESSLASA